MPKAVCITNLYNKNSTAGSSQNFFQAGVWVGVSQLSAAVEEALREAAGTPCEDVA